MWFDISDIVDWQGPLTGIQRTTVSLLHELKSAVGLRLYRFNFVKPAFVEVEWSALPHWLRHAGPAEQGRGGTPPAARRSADPPPAAGTVGRVGRRRPLERLEARLPAELRPSFAEFRAGLTAFRRAVKAWIRSRGSARGRRTAAEFAADFPGSSLNYALNAPPPCPFAAGDIVCSFGASWLNPPPVFFLKDLKRSRGFRYVCLIYDLIPTLHPEWMIADVSAKITSWLRLQLATADLVLTISEFSKSEILRYCDETSFKPAHVGVIRLGDNLSLRSRADLARTPALPRYVPDRPFVIVVSVIDVRKNHDCLYRVWKLLARRLGAACPRLLFIGRPHLHVDTLLHQVAHDREINGLIDVLSDIPDGELLWYYRHCLFTLYPSIYEGWGVPVGESLAMGRYCIASNAASVPEVGGDLVDYFDPYDALACLELVLRAIRDPAYVARREAEIAARYRLTMWSDVARQVVDNLDAIGRPGGSAAADGTGGQR
ncbi:MAG: glycosyltransferase family 4 protein [Alphaproteobacteria bacterium]|nr:glycosyltransferase family 4 protein [Alphaproteobacteria bacterium]